MLFVGPGGRDPIPRPSSRARGRGEGGEECTDGDATHAGSVAAVRMPVVWSERHRGHATDGGYWLGVRLPGDEEPERGDLLRDALLAAGASISAPVEHGDAALLAVHTGEFVEFMAGAYDRWVAAGYAKDPGQPVVVPYVFALRQLTPGRAAHAAASVHAEVGRFAIDTMTLIGAATYDAARAAVDCALTAADLVLDGRRGAYAAVRPPGHHAGADFFGGSCYLNNAACAAQYLRDRGVARVAVIDVDAHHGNGTQEIFYDRDDVFYGSVHVDPGAGWFPHFVGFAEERGHGDGIGANHNIPLAPGGSDDEWLRAIDELATDAAEHGAGALVVSLGVDASRQDPESPLAVTGAGFAAAGRRLAALDLPTVFVQEGGYHLGTFADLVLSFLGGFEDGE
jgi:acetoin utilization deacetylase AcuC-like enzyme